MRDYNVFDGTIGFFVFLFMMIGFITHNISTSEMEKKQMEKIEILTEKVEALTCSVDSLENYLCD